MITSSPAKQQASPLDNNIFTSSSLLDTLALSGHKQTLLHTLSESVSNQRPATGSIPTAQSLRSVPTAQEPSVEAMNEPVTSRDAHRRAHVIKHPLSTFNTGDLPGILATANIVQYSLLYIGVHNVDIQARKTAQQHKQEEAVTRIQAAYRGHQVRKSLQWNTSTHQKVQQSKSAPLTNDAACNGGHKQNTATRSKKSTKKKLQDKTKAVEEVSLETVHVDSSVHSIGSVPATSVPPWEQAGGDMMSVINIYTRQYEKLQEQFNATAGV